MHSAGVLVGSQAYTIREVFLCSEMWGRDAMVGSLKPDHLRSCKTNMQESFPVLCRRTMIAETAWEV